MRSSTIFIVFGIILVGFILFIKLSENSAAHGPEMTAARGFLQAVADQDVKALEGLLDPATSTMATAGTRLTAIRFDECSPIGGAFARRPGVLYNYLQLSQLDISKDTQPTVVKQANIATVDLTNGGKIYLKDEKKDGHWRVIYIAKPEDEAK